MAMRESQKTGNKRYQDSKCIRISLILGKDVGEILLNHIAKNGETKNGFIIQAIKEKIEKETGKKFDDLMSEMRAADEVGSAETAEDLSAKAGRKWAEKVKK